MKHVSRVGRRSPWIVTYFPPRCIRWVTAHPRIEISHDEVTELPSPGIIATGPLTSDALSSTIQARLGIESLAFYDAIAPIVSGESIDLNVVFRASRYGKETMADPARTPAARASPATVRT